MLGVSVLFLRIQNLALVLKLCTDPSREADHLQRSRENIGGVRLKNNLFNADIRGFYPRMSAEINLAGTEMESLFQHVP